MDLERGNILLFIQRVKGFVYTYQDVINNYVFMTLLNFFNSFFALLIYPMVLPIIGVDSYGLYIFYNSIILFLLIFVNFGFDLLALKKITFNKDDKKNRQIVFFEVFWAKMYLLLLICSLTGVGLFFLKDNIVNIWLFLAIFAQSFSVFLPTWYYQAMSNMKYFSVIQVLIKIITFFAIMFLINDNGDNVLFAIIMSLSLILTTVISFLMVVINEKFFFVFFNFGKLLDFYRESSAFFFNNLVIGLKDNGIVWYMGLIFGLREIAIYDLAQKVVSPLRTLFISINTAIFPRFIKEVEYGKIKKLIIAEGVIGFLAVLIIVIFGYLAVDFLGNGQLDEAYPMAIILGLTIPLWLVAGCFINFVFVSHSAYYVLVKSQIWALLSLWLLIMIISSFYSGIFLIPLVIVLSGMVELICYYINAKNIF